MQRLSLVPLHDFWNEPASEVVRTALTIQKELSMNKAVLVGLTILALSSSAASAWTHRTYHTSRAMYPNASAAAIHPNAYGHPMNAYAAMGAPAGVSSKDYEMYMKNLHDSGYDPKNDYTAAGTVKNQ